MDITKYFDIFSCNEVTYLNHTHFGPRIQNDFQLVYVFKGEMDITIDQVTRNLQAGEATLLLPGKTETFEFAKNGATHHGWCSATLTASHMANLKNLGIPQKTITLTNEMIQIVSLLTPLIRENRREREQYKVLLISALYEAYFFAAGYSPANSTPTHPAVEKALRIIHKHYHQELNTQTLAKQTGITSTHLTRLFKEHLSKTPKTVLWETRCTAAKRLLKETGLTAAEIAYQTGFANPQHFSRVFKQYEGCSPASVRKSS